MESEAESVQMESVDGDVHSLRGGVGSLGGASEQWIMMGRTFPRSEVRYFCQVTILYVVIFTCLANLSVGSGKLNALWISLLSSCIGYLLPSPHISRRAENRNAVSTTQLQ